MTVRRTAMQRSQRQLRISAPVALDKRRAQLGYDALLESEQQFQLPISGVASTIGAWATIEVVFDLEFFDAPEQRNSSLAVPLFTYGAFIDPTTTGDALNPTGAVMVTACVQEWNIDTRGAYIGATIAVGTSAMGGADVTFTGYLHLAFQGYGAPAENVEALDVGI